MSRVYLLLVTLLTKPTVKPLLQPELVAWQH
jgi:hypothetical protein